MAVSVTTMIDKMKNELALAEDGQHDAEVMKRHISRVQLLCELLLQEEGTVSAGKPKNEITAEEMKAMLGAAGPGKTEHKLNHEEANGDSIFDF